MGNRAEASTALSKPSRSQRQFKEGGLRRRGPSLAQALAGQIEAAGGVNDPVEDGVGERGNADQVNAAGSRTRDLRPPRFGG